jgi:hypothetical protein
MPPILKNPLPQAVLAWLLFAVPVLLTAHAALDTDSAMRLVQVRDLLHGQAWFDVTQYRMNPPAGVAMHWSRLLDAPLALLMWIGGEGFMLAAWPLLMFFAVLWALARLGLIAGGRIAVPVTLLLALLCVFLLPDFAPGAIDHHTLQMALMLWGAVALVEGRAIPAALLTALALAVGLEVLPYAMAIAVCAALWLTDRREQAWDFGLWLAIAALVLLVVIADARYRFHAACDTYSLLQAALLVTGGLGLAAISFLPRRRLVAVAALALVLIALAALLAPACLAGPYGGMDAQLRAIFLARINEARSAVSFFTFAPSEWVGGVFYGAVIAGLSLLQPRSRARCLLIALSLTALAVSLWQVRGVPFLILFALPGFAAMLARLLQARGIVAFAAALLLGNQAAFAVAGVIYEGTQAHGARIAAFGHQTGCAAPAAVGILNARPKGLVAAFVDQGPAILAATKDTVLAGPYHRDAQGILDSYRIFTLPRDQARAVLKARGVSYVMVCTAAPDWDFYRRSGPGGIVAARPGWLTPLDRHGDVFLYRVD